MRKKRPNPIVAMLEARANRKGAPEWVPASGRAGYGFALRELPPDARRSLAHFLRGGEPRFRRDGSAHGNYARDLPDGPGYRELTVVKHPSVRHGGVASPRQRFVFGDDGSIYFTASHYDRAPKNTPAEEKRTLRDAMDPKWQNAMYRVKTTPVLERKVKRQMAKLERERPLTAERGNKQRAKPQVRSQRLRQERSQRDASRAQTATSTRTTTPGGTDMATSRSPLTPQFNRAAKPPAPTPPKLTPTFNAASSVPRSKPPPGPAPVLKPHGGPPGPGLGSSAPAITQNASPKRSATVKPPQPPKTLTQNFNQQAKGPKR